MREKPPWNRPPWMVIALSAVIYAFVIYVGWMWLWPAFIRSVS